MSVPPDGFESYFDRNGANSMRFIVMNQDISLEELYQLLKTRMESERAASSATAPQEGL